jgi:hypothetical protein
MGKGEQGSKQANAHTSTPGPSLARCLGLLGVSCPHAQPSTAAVGCHQLPPGPFTRDSAKLIKRCGDGVEDQGAKEAFRGHLSINSVSLGSERLLPARVFTLRAPAAPSPSFDRPQTWNGHTTARRRCAPRRRCRRWARCAAGCATATPRRAWTTRGCAPCWTRSYAPPTPPWCPRRRRASASLACGTRLHAPPLYTHSPDAQTLSVTQ